MRSKLNGMFHQDEFPSLFEKVEEKKQLSKAERNKVIARVFVSTKDKEEVLVKTEDLKAIFDEIGELERELERADALIWIKDE
jgi:hypothetical protein